MSDDTPATRLATRAAFLASGFAMAAWAPLVPYAKARVGLDEAALGLLLLCLGAGSLSAMPLSAALVDRFGCRRIILAAGAGLALTLPGLAYASQAVSLGAVLLLFGASLGTMDVAMNVHAVAVERAAKVPLMSGFHGLFSVGGLLGAVAVTALLAAGLPPFGAALLAAGLVALAVLVAAPGLLRARAAGGPLFVRPHGFVLLLSALAFAAFLAEGAVLDWSALLLTQDHGLPTAQGGIGYVVFSLAMSVGRLTGDRLVAALGGRRVLLWGGLAAAGGVALLGGAPSAMAGLAGLALTGLGASNLVPVLFSAIGRQHAMPVGLAVGAVTTIGYAGILTGPAAIGFLADLAGLPAAFIALAALLLVIPAASAKAGGQ